MGNEIIANGATTTKDYDISAYESVTVFCRGGTGAYTLAIGVDKDKVLTHSTPAVDTITTITDNANVLTVTINATPGAYDIIGYLR